MIDAMAVATGEGAGGALYGDGTVGFVAVIAAIVQAVTALPVVHASPIRA